MGTITKSVKAKREEHCLKGTDGKETFCFYVTYQRETNLNRV